MGTASRQNALIAVDTKVSLDLAEGMEDILDAALDGYPPLTNVPDCVDATSIRKAEVGSIRQTTTVEI